MDSILFLAIFSQFISLVQGSYYCTFFYYSCSGYDWCCPNGYVCTGSSTCLSIGAIVGIAIGSVVGLGITVAVVCILVKKKGHTGRVIQPTTTIAHTSAQQQFGGQPNYGGQYGQPQYGGPPQYGGQFGYEQPAYPPPPQYK